MSSLSPRRQQESHRVYLQQFTHNADIHESSINTTSAAIRLTLAATCQDVTQLLRQKFGLPPLHRAIIKASGSSSALDRINAHLAQVRSTSQGTKSNLDALGGPRHGRRKHDPSIDDALVVVASCFLPRGYLRFEHESKDVSGLNQDSPEAFNLFRTLLPDENPLQVKNEMWTQVQQLQEEANALFGANEDLSTARRPRKAPVIRLFFMPCHNSGVSNATIEIEGYCTGAESDDDDDEEEGDDANDCISNGKNAREADDISPLPQWKRELISYSCQDKAILSKNQRILVKDRHRLAILSGLEMASGNECVSGYLLKQSKTDNNIWKKVHCVLPNNQQFWYVSRIKEIGPEESPDANMITTRYLGKHGIIHLNGTLLIEPIDPVSPLFGIPCTFQLITKEGETHVFRASSRNAYLRWMECISGSIVQCQENSYFELAEEIVRQESLARAVN